MKRQSITFTEHRKPIVELVTKFGGQPVWAQQPQWPISKSTGRPMRFVCQIAISEEVFGRIEPRMAYIFMTDEHDFVEETWEPDGGENAVILQPGVPTIPVQPIAGGPTLYRMAKKMFRSTLVPELCEFLVGGPISDDPPFVGEPDRASWSDAQFSEYAATLDGNKIGGTPIFLQGDEYPDEGPWMLLLQLDSANVPFSINFGDAGVGYAFISEDGTKGKFLWQCA